MIMQGMQLFLPTDDLGGSWKNETLTASGPVSCLELCARFPVFKQDLLISLSAGTIPQEAWQRWTGASPVAT